MFQIVLIAAVLAIFLLYMKSSRGEMKVKKPKDELELRCDFFQQEVLDFINRLKRYRSKTRISRLESEIERFQKVMDLDDLLERAERETNSQKAIDYYLEALSFIMKNDFEKERKVEIEEKIKALQQSKGKQLLK
ncbi:hypothetical protein J7K97_01660 [Candidatus Aerophobetes bacterium]|nr:hypothetical protein [Candidatus Aerophobetes bacterium]